MNKLSLSPQGAALLTKREGVRYNAYKDTKGIWTIGIGHTGPEVVKGLVWTHEQVMEAFKHDIKWAEAAVNATSFPLKHHQFDALVSFVFNVGANAYFKSTMRKMLNAGMVKEATAQFDRWVYPKEITGRRMSEKAQFSGK